MTTGTISAQPNANSAIVGKAQPGLGSSTKFAATLNSDTSSMIRKPCRIWRRGAIFPAKRPLTQAPPMMPAIVSRKNQKNCVGARPRWSPRKAGADNTYRNMPLNGTPLARASRKKRGLEPNCQ